MSLSSLTAPAAGGGPPGSSSSSDGSSEHTSDAETKSSDVAILAQLQRMDAKFDKVTADFAGLTATVQQLSGDVTELKSGQAHPRSLTPAPPKTPAPRSGMSLVDAVGRIAAMGASGGATPRGVPLGAQPSIKEQLRTSSDSFGVASARPVVKPSSRLRRDHSDSDSDSSSSAADRRSRRKPKGRSGSRRGRGNDDDEPSLDGPLAPGIIQKLYYGHFRSAYEYVEHQAWEKDRNKHEARRHAQVLDSFIFAGATPDMEGIEILCRNISALVIADQAKDMHLLEVIEYDPPDELLPAQVRRSAFKDAERLRKLRAGPKKGAGGAGGAGGQAAGGHP